MSDAPELGLQGAVSLLMQGIESEIFKEQTVLLTHEPSPVSAVYLFLF